MHDNYLYIDHQSLAPIIHALEDVVQYSCEIHDYRCKTVLMLRPKI